MRLLGKVFDFLLLRASIGRRRSDRDREKEHASRKQEEPWWVVVRVVELDFRRT